MSAKAEDHWSSEAYQNAAAFVPKLATKVVQWLDVQPGDVILDVGCGDGVLNLQFADTLSKGTGSIHGVDSSVEMIRTSKEKVEAAGPAISKICSFEVLDATKLPSHPSLQTASYDKVFSNAAMHWILTPKSTRGDFFRGVHAALKPGGIFCFEMGGMGNVAEMRTALLSVVGRRIGIAKAREVDPWFFPDEIWMRPALEGVGFQVERLEREFRPTRVGEGGVEGWVRLMGKQFFDAVGEGEREGCVREVCEVLKTVCEGTEGQDWIGYVRLRGLARKI